MSNVLKKITKKYKWLRFLNRKVTKLSVLGASLVGLCVSSGASFAKYRDENYGNGDAGAARFGAKIENTTKFIYLPTIGGTNSPSGYYAFAAEFCVDFSECEVKTKYNLGLKLCGRYSTNYDNPEYKASITNFALTGKTTTVYTAEGEENKKSTIIIDGVEELLTDNAYSSFDLKTTYCATKINNGNYVWESKRTTNYQELNFTNMSANPGDLHYFKILYFVYIISANAEISIILSNLEVEQVV